MFIGDILRKMDFIEITPYVFVYKNLHEDSQKLFDYIKTIEVESDGSYIFSSWSDWFVFGEYCSAKIPGHGHIPDANRISDPDRAEIDRIEEYCYTQIRSTTIKAINHYSKYHNIKWPDGAYVTDPNIAKYDDDNEIGDEKKPDKDGLRMVFHSDYPINEWFWPGRKFLITGNTYFNDDYDGGEIIFLTSEKITIYKPEAGDIVVFPSGSPLFPNSPSKSPFFHAVNKITNGNKYFVRSYVIYDNNDLTYWNSKKSEFPNEEEWDQFIEKVSRSNDNTAAVYMGGPSPVLEDNFIKHKKIDRPRFSVSNFSEETDFYIGVTPLVIELFDLQDNYKYIGFPDYDDELGIIQDLMTQTDI